MPLSGPRCGRPASGGAVSKYGRWPTRSGKPGRRIPVHARHGCLRREGISCPSLCNTPTHPPQTSGDPCFPHAIVGVLRCRQQPAASTVTKETCASTPDGDHQKHCDRPSAEGGRRILGLDLTSLDPNYPGRSSATQRPDNRNPIRPRLNQLFAARDRVTWWNPPASTKHLGTSSGHDGHVLAKASKSRRRPRAPLPPFTCQLGDLSVSPGRPPTSTRRS